MTKNCNDTQITGFGVFHGSFELWIFLALLCVLLVLSLCWNVLCCFGRACGDKGKKFLPRFRRSISLKLKDMEDNPIYGNISYTQTKVDLPLNPPVPSPRKKGKRSSQDQTAFGGRDCYANLTLKVPKPASGRSSPVPQIQYSDVANLPRTSAEPEPDEQQNPIETDTTSLLSDLYASVDTERNKVKAPDSHEAYANHV